MPWVTTNNRCASARIGQGHLPRREHEVHADFPGKHIQPARKIPRLPKVHHAEHRTRNAAGEKLQIRRFLATVQRERASASQTLDILVFVSVPVRLSRNPGQAVKLHCGNPSLHQVHVLGLRPPRRDTAKESERNRDTQRVPLLGRQQLANRRI